MLGPVARQGRRLRGLKINFPVPKESRGPSVRMLENASIAPRGPPGRLTF